MAKYDKLSDLIKKRFTKKTALRMLTKTKQGRIALVVLGATGVHKLTTKEKKKVEKHPLDKTLFKQPVASKLEKLSKYAKKYEGKGWKNFILDLKANVKDKKSIGGETVIMKSGGGYIDDLI